MSQLQKDLENSLIYRQNETPPHYHLEVCQYLNNILLERWGEDGSSIAWPPETPDLNSLDFFFYGGLKNLMYVQLLPNDVMTQRNSNTGFICDVTFIRTARPPRWNFRSYNACAQITYLCVN